MYVRRFVLLFVLILALPTASAAALSAPVLLGFSASYAGADGAPRIHHGIDVSLEGGAKVPAPVAGTVRFAGRVPTASGETAGCVTLETESGLVTLMPLERICVTKGADISSGESVGTLAETGDPSVGATHLHVGLKKGEMYLDPSVLLVPAASTSVQEPAAQEIESQATKPSVSRAVVAAAPGVAVVGADASVASPLGDVAVHPTAEAAAEVGNAPEGGTAAQGLPSGVSLADSGVAVQVPGSAASLNVNTERMQSRGSLIQLPTSKTPSLSLESGSLAPAVGVLAAMVAVSFLIVTRRSLTMRVRGEGPVSDRLGTLLQHLKAGDTLCGLTSCPAPLPSQSRGH